MAVGLSPKQRELRDREELILNVARELLLDRGYFGITMDRIAKVSQCPKGTMYQHFACKEDIIIALARQCFEARLAMMRRAAAFEGKTREKVVAMGEAVGLFERLRTDDSRIIHTATGPIREKAHPARVEALVRTERENAALLRSILVEAITRGELALEEPATVEEMAFAIWALVDGSFTLIESGLPGAVLGIQDPHTRMFRAFGVLADGYGWRPLSTEWDWEETLANVRRTVFPEEAQVLYGEGTWHGDRG